MFIATVISGSLANEIEELIHDPSQIITVLANGAPSQAVFFMSYLLLLALTVKPISLLRLPGEVLIVLERQIPPPPPPTFHDHPGCLAEGNVSIEHYNFLSFA